jgi:hypothetical protein
MPPRRARFFKMARTLDNPFYYLDNFQRAIEWIGERYGDLLDTGERAFIEGFAQLPQTARALLVRMVMRKGPLFRASKLSYPEIGDHAQAAAPLVRLGWVDGCPHLSLEQLFGLLTKAEIAQAFVTVLPSAKKAEQLALLRAAHPDSRPFPHWYADADDCVYQITIGALCERLKLMFFGNCHQDWTEFVLSDLGIVRYEQVDICPAARGFRTREDIDDYLLLHRCRERLDQGEPAEQLAALIPAQALANAWLEGRRQKLLFGFGQHHERAGELSGALRAYADCRYQGARIRQIRVLEKCAQPEQAYALAAQAWQQPESEAERQQLARILPRLQRKLGQARMTAPTTPAAPEFELLLPKPEPFLGVEPAVRDHLSRPGAPVHYVENTLINSLFGLLCWKAIFSAVPGAFFHPFHSGPADLHSPDFLQRRQHEFAQCLAQLDDDGHRDTIRRHYHEKTGIQSPFVFWDALDEELLEQALACIPAAHLKLWFQRILQDIRANRAGLPDLIRFDLDQRRYQMIEVKGPGDRLQDNQTRWLAYCMQHEMPVSVCYLQWTPAQ